MAQIINITSEALQANIRRLLPSQQGFGEDLQATNVVTPIIDLTPTAEGSSVPSYLQRAWDYSVQVQSATNTIATLTGTAGFYQVDLTMGLGSAPAAASAQVYLSDGLTNRNIWRFTSPSAGSTPTVSVTENTFVVYVDVGNTLYASTTNANLTMDIWLRQIADVSGILTNPLGFNPQ